MHLKQTDEIRGWREATAICAVCQAIRVERLHLEDPGFISYNCFSCVCVRAHMRVFVKEVESASLFFCDLERCVCALSASPHPSHTSDLPCLCPVFIASSEVSL